MLKIGDFSMLSQISIYMLRHYNEIGLLIPAHVDECTGYRYYTEEQLPVANRIQALKDMGFGLAIIKDILNEYKNDRSFKRYLTIQTAQKQEEIEALQRQLLLLHTTIKSLNTKSDLPKCNITVKVLPKRKVICYRSIIQTYNQEGILWGNLSNEFLEQNVQFATPGHNIAIFHNEGYVDQGIDVEIQRTVLGTYEDTENAKFKIVEPITVASMTFKGGYDQLKEVNHEIAHWIIENNYVFDGPMFNIYHVSPETEQIPEHMVTQVCFPIKEK